MVGGQRARTVHVLHHEERDAVGQGPANEHPAAEADIMRTMAVNAAILRRRRLARKGIGMPGNNDRILSVARSLADRVDAPVLGGIAVYLHGYPRATADLDLYTPDRRA